MTGTGWFNVFTALLFFFLGGTGAVYIIKNASGDSTTHFSILGPVFLTVGLAFFGLLFVRRLPLQRRLAVEGIAVRGTITERESYGPSKGRITLDYTFRIASNGEIEVGTCPSDRYRKAGTEVWILYLPADPRRSQIYPSGIDFFRIEE